MGKKNKKEKKGKGKEKTALKTEKKADKRAKKELAEKGEEDIEKLIADFQEKDKSRTQVVEEKCGPPSSRCNMTLTAHPTKDELIMFGGEFCTGNKMYMYNDLLFYNIKKKEWTKVTAPNAPPPRSSHQAVAVKHGGGALWIFGGEFASPTQSQFYHYKELWVYHIKDKVWEKVSAHGGPTSRSGHRMVQYKKYLIVFGGFHDNIRDYRYYNDLYAFDLENYSWTKLDPSGPTPPARSGCVMAALQDQPKIVIYGGYSKERIKRDIDKGTIHTDMYMLTTEGKVKDDTTPLKWKWVHLKQSGTKPSPRCGMSIAVTPGNRAICFGGVFDQEEDEEEIEGVFYNEMYTLDLERGKWFSFSLRGKKSGIEKRKRRRKKEEGQEGEDDVSDEEVDSDEDDDIVDAEEDIKKLKLEQSDTNIATGAESDKVIGSEQHTDSLTASGGSDDIFKVTVGPQSSGQQSGSAEDCGNNEMDVDIFMPSARMGALLTVKNGELFIYGGLTEAGDKQLTYSDFYSLDLHKLEEWNTLIASDIQKQEWSESDSSDDEGKGACGGEEMEDEDEDDSDEDIESLLEGCDVPQKGEEEEVLAYFERTMEFWEAQSKKYFENENMDVSKRTVIKFAREMCKEYCDK